MVDPREDLRAVLQARQSKEDAATRKAEQEKAELNREAARYENEEREVIAHLREVADLVLATLTENVPTEKIPITPARTGLGKFFPPKKAEGWKISSGQGSEYVLCPNGTVVYPQRYFTSPQPRYSTLMEQVEGRLRKMHDAPFSESPHSQIPSLWAQAFSWTSPSSGDSRTAAQERMRVELQEAQRQTTEWLAGLLHERGVSL
jgi:hypothetical protein